MFLPDEIINIILSYREVHPVSLLIKDAIKKSENYPFSNKFHLKYFGSRAISEIRQLIIDNLLGFDNYNLLRINNDNLLRINNDNKLLTNVRSGYKKKIRLWVSRVASWFTFG